MRATTRSFRFFVLSAAGTASAFAVAFALGFAREGEARPEAPRDAGVPSREACERPGPARGHRPAPPPPLAMVAMRHAEELGLSDETVERIESIAASARERMQPLRESVHDAHDALRALMESEHLDGEAAVAAARRLGEAETAIVVERVRTDVAVGELLSAEQLDALRELGPRRPPDARDAFGEGQRFGVRGERGPHREPATSDSLG